MVGTLLKKPKIQKNQRLLVLAGALVWIVLPCQLRVAMMLDGNGLRIPAPLVEADQETNEQNYLLWRIEKGVAEGSTEISKCEAIPFEYNLEGLNAISFDKGCYVGQEFITCTHHRGIVRKRLLSIMFLNDGGIEAEQKVALGSEVIDKTSGKKVGSVTTALGCQGLGLLRLEEAFKGSGSLTIEGQEDLKFEAIRPNWWPAEWFQERGGIVLQPRML